MMLNGGVYNGKRILAPATVRMMTQNQLGLVARSSSEDDFGLGFGIVNTERSARLPAPEGSYYWAGMYATHFWVDPKNKMFGLLFRQIWPTSQWDMGDRYQSMVYQALEN
jgi:CubicO group peptidase (beta-lactamase class C family)